MAKFKWTEGQKNAMATALARYEAGEKYTTIVGSAGTGKSSSADAIVSMLNIPKQDVAFVSYTGCASEVLKSKGNNNCSTIHKLIFQSRRDKNGKFMNILKSSIPYKVVVVDEISMVPKSLLRKLMSFPAYFIFLGDDKQLPPIKKDDDNDIIKSPHVILTEITRQAAENDIIQMTALLREGQPLPAIHEGQNIKILPKNDLNTGMLLWADQILCSTNKTRMALNDQVRKLKGLPENTIQEGEKVICLHNYWDNVNESGDALTNGKTGFLTNIREDFYYLPPKYWVEHFKVPIIRATFCETDDFNPYTSYEIIIDKKMFYEGESSFTKKEQYYMNKDKQISLNLPLDFTYGYAITVWKAQGQEFNKVLVLEEGFPYEPDLKNKLLYTALTRAKDKVVLIRK